MPGGGGMLKGARASPPPALRSSLASRMRDSKADDGFLAVLSSPRLITSRCTPGELLLSMSAALSSTSLVRMKSSTARASSLLPR